MSVIKKIGFLSAFILPVLFISGYFLGGGWNFLTVAFVFVLIPVLDYIIGKDPENVRESAFSTISEERYYRFILYLWVFVQWALVIFGSWAVTLGQIQTPLEWVGFVLSMALITGGIGITVAHELGHKKSGLERFYAQAMLASVYYMHFYIEHNKGHHVQVGTPADPATSRKNESFYAFWWRSVKGSYLHAWNLEKKRLERKGKQQLGLNNLMWYYTVIPLILCGLLTFFFSGLTGAFAWQVIVFFLAQSILAFSLLEVVNYIEHYGLVRKEIKPGIYERVNEFHSWNANHLLTNFFLFQLQRHSDHHINAIKRYQVLDHLEESPQLPAGYPTMLLAALVPPLWFSWVNPLLDQWQKKKSVGVAA